MKVHHGKKGGQNMLRIAELVTSAISSVFYLLLISFTYTVWKKVKSNSFYLLPLIVSFFILLVHKFIVVTSAIGNWRIESKITLAHSLVFAILFQAIFFVDKYFEDRERKMKALTIISGILLAGYVLGLQGIALAVAIIEVVFVFISPETLLTYAFAVYFLVDFLYVVDSLFGGCLIYSYIFEAVGTLLFYLGFRKVINNLLKNVKEG